MNYFPLNKNDFLVRAEFRFTTPMRFLFLFLIATIIICSIDHISVVTLYRRPSAERNSSFLFDREGPHQLALKKAAPRHLAECQLTDCQLASFNLVEYDWADCDLTDCYLPNCHLTDCHLSNCQLANCYLTLCQLTDCHLVDCLLADCHQADSE